MPGVREALDGAEMARWGQLCLDGLERHRDEINALNVFPVADSDTGTNLLATMRAAVAAGGQTDSARAALDAMARAGTVGARGNSGIILSQVLRGFAEAVDAQALIAPMLPVALRRGAVLVREALSAPVEGTMLTVLEAAADRVADVEGESLAEIALAAADGAAKALVDTPSQLGVLREAGVVDAGARGLLVLFDALVEVITGRAPARPAYQKSDAYRDPSLLPAAGATLDIPRYEVMYLLSDTDEQRIAVLREGLAALGDSVVVVGDGGGRYSTHVHCADAGAAVEAGLAAGVLSNIRIEGLAVNPLAVSDPADRGILVVASGAGAVRLFEDAGAVVLGGPVTAEVLLEAIRRMPHREVLVLPNGALPAHELVAVSVAARDGRREVLMLPSGSMVQGLAALALHDDGRTAVDDAFTMSEAAAGTRWGALRIATERALTIVGTCERNDGLGLVGHDVVVIDPDPGRAARTLLDRMLGLGGELVTLLLGADAPSGLADELAEHISATFPGVEVVSYEGGQPVDLVQIGVE